MSRADNIAGKTYGHLTVESFVSASKGHAYWLCRCDCGNYTVARGSHLKSGNVSSCGCRKGHITHGGSRARLYYVWSNMIARCSNPKNIGYSSYGGRGIKVCDEWLNDFQAFHDWAIANGYDETAPRGECTIDRIDNDGSYCPENCRWTTAKVQANNTRRTRFIEFDGECLSVSEWARRLGMNQSTLSMRINKYGWSADKALRKEVRNYGS